MGQYSEQGLAAAVEEGLASREAVLRAGVEASGGTLEALYFAPPHTGYDFVAISTGDSDMVFSTTVNTAMSAAFGRNTQVIELRTGEEADAAIAATVPPGTYKGPGESA